MFKSGFVCILGLPNVGKSTLLNLILETKLSIVTSKPQTTRKNVTGIVNGDNYQIIIVDTPGIHTSEKLINKEMISYIDKAIEGIDVAVVMLDKRGMDSNVQQYAEKLSLSGTKLIMLINKTDTMSREEINTIREHASSSIKFEKVIETSLTSDPEAKEKILTAIVDLLEEGPPYYDRDIISTDTERFIASELIREKIMEMIAEEIPYSTAVVIEDFKFREPKDIYYIRANIIVEKETHKGIIIGAGGKMIKKIGQSAREDLERFLGKKVFLDLHVKVNKGWTKKKNLVKEYLNPSF